MATTLKGKPPCLVVDVGANVGYMSLFAASLGHRVHGFEPVSEFYRLVAMAIVHNKYENIIRLTHAAASNVKGESTVYALCMCVCVCVCMPRPPSSLLLLMSFLLLF
jgi:protein-L-isoaspartate O-methyltransferase